jgi:hypothetical protein
MRSWQSATNGVQGIFLEIFGHPKCREEPFFLMERSASFPVSDHGHCQFIEVGVHGF